MGRAQHRRRAVFQIQFEVGLADALIVGMIDAPAQFPVKSPAHRHHGVVVFGVIGDLAERHHAGIQRSISPVVGLPFRRWRRRRLRQLPITDLFHRREDLVGNHLTRRLAG